jgi:hypothetical protein
MVMTLHPGIHRADVPAPYPTGDLPRVLGRWRSRRGMVALAALAFASSFQLSQARAEDHHHPAADVPIHEQFYSSWMMPDKPERSCCNKRDCYPTEARYRDGFWEARRREDGQYVRVPWEKVEQNRDNPDGRNHVCMPPPSPNYYGDEVYCFALGGGI